jgi:cysteine synthase A
LVVDPENSVFHDYYRTGDASVCISQGSKIEGIGRPRVEPSFIAGVVDEMKTVKDAQSIVTMQWLETILGRSVGPSTGTNVFGVLTAAKQMQTEGKTGSIVTLLCDSGSRYLDTYYNPTWVETNIGDLSEATNDLLVLLEG